MSRVHDALRRAEQSGPPVFTPSPSVNGTPLERTPSVAAFEQLSLSPSLLDQVQEVPFTPAPESHMVDSNTPQQSPGEEFRSLRTRLNHLQSLQPIHSVVVTSASPGEGKSFTSANLALTESHLTDNLVLLADFDLRRSVIHRLFQIDRTPGVADYLTGQVPLVQTMRKIAGTNLYVMPAGSPVKNPLELLNLKELKVLLDELPKLFNWIILDTPPLLFSADANLLATLTDGTILVVRVGFTTIDSVTRAMQSLCENNVLGIVANAARASELYSKYTYYYYSSKTD